MFTNATPNQMLLRLAFHLYLFLPMKWCYILSLPVFLSFIESAPTNSPVWLDDLSTTWNHFRKLPRSGPIPTFHVHHFKTPFTTILLICAQWSWHEETYTKIRVTCVCYVHMQERWLLICQGSLHIHTLFYLCPVKLIRQPSEYLPVLWHGYPAHVCCLSMSRIHLWPL